MGNGNIGQDAGGRARLADEKGQRAGCIAKSIIKAISSERLSGWRRRRTVNELDSPHRQVKSEIFELSNELSEWSQFLIGNEKFNGTIGCEINDRL
jgi:hypothetical protein